MAYSCCGILCLPDDEINKMKTGAEVNAESDNKTKETPGKINRVVRLIFQKENRLQEYED